MTRRNQKDQKRAHDHKKIVEQGLSSWQRAEARRREYPSKASLLQQLQEAVRNTKNTNDA